MRYDVYNEGYWLNLRTEHTDNRHESQIKICVRSISRTVVNSTLFSLSKISQKECTSMRWHANVARIQEPTPRVFLQGMRATSVLTMCVSRDLHASLRTFIVYSFPCGCGEGYVCACAFVDQFKST